MAFELQRWNRHGESVERPTLQQILEFGQPFAATLPLRGGQRIADEILLGNWADPGLDAWQGIALIDRKSKTTYLLGLHDYQDGERAFESRDGILSGLNLDKYRTSANWYRFNGEYPQELFNGFEELGFTFEGTR